MSIQARIHAQLQDHEPGDGSYKCECERCDLFRTILAQEDKADLRHEFDNWDKSTEFTRTCKNPVDAGDQMALRDAYKLLSKALA